MHFQSKPHNKSPYTSTLNSCEVHHLRSAISDLKTLGALELCSHKKDEIICPYFLRKNPNGKYRFIFNLKGLNSYMVAPHFKLEDYRSVLKLLQPNYYMCSLDLNDVYFVVNVHPKSRKFLRLAFEGNLWQFTCLPFGLCTSPFIFQKC